MISYNHYDCSYKFTNRRIINRWLKESALEEGYQMGELNVIFCSAVKLLEINNEFLQHNYFTDIITFDYSDLIDEKYIAGELYIDIETVADNASLYGATPLREMHRILIHGVMHLCGQGDKTEDSALEMRRKENHYLSKLDELIATSSTK